MRARMAWVVALALGAPAHGVLVLGCSPPATEIVAVVDSDLAAGTELASVSVSATIGTLGTSTHEFEVGPSGLDLPFSFGIAAPEGRTSSPVRVHVVGVGPDGVTVVRWAAETSFVPGRTVRLDVPLARACAGDEACAASDLVCERGECRAAAIDPASLPTIEPGAAPPRSFSGPSDPGDAGADAASCTAGSPCDTGNPCRPGVQRCDPIACEAVAPMPPGTPCGDGRACDGTGACAAAEGT